MPNETHDGQKPEIENARAAKERLRADDALEDEEKILDGRPDVNMPALLTKDVQGG